MTQYTVAIIDAGGRGASLVHKYSQSPSVSRILAIPGNDLMQMNSNKPVVTYQHLKTTSVAEILDICKKEQVRLVDVAQDNAVAVGLVDNLNKNNIPAFGPTKAAGEIEWNKAFSREFMTRHEIPQPEYKIFHTSKEGIVYLQTQPDQPWFVKASGLAEGKGALSAKNNAEAEERIIELQRFGDAGKTYLLEKWLTNTNGSNAEEFSAFAFCDGKNFKIIGYAQDHKRVFDNDEGENTGGMGCSTPPLVISPAITKQVEEIFTKTFRGLTDEGRQYKGILYLGGILIQDIVYVIEFNARWGDPEAEVLIPGITEDMFDISEAIIRGDISNFPIASDGKARVAVAAASKGYPGDYSEVKGKEIIGLEKVKTIPDVVIYGAGVQVRDGKYYANGGRLFYIVGKGENVIEAREKTYNALSLVSIEGDNLHYRKDIGWRDVERLKK